MSYWEQERNAVLEEFVKLLIAVTGDGSKKRQSGVKPPWWRDDSHEAAIFSHLNKWKHGEKKDPDSGVHPLVHLAWRALAIAYQETHGKVDPVDPNLAIESKSLGGPLRDPVFVGRDSGLEHKQERPEGLETGANPRHSSWDKNYLAYCRVRNSGFHD